MQQHQKQPRPVTITTVIGLITAAFAIALFVITVSVYATIWYIN